MLMVEYIIDNNGHIIKKNNKIPIKKFGINNKRIRKFCVNPNQESRNCVPFSDI